MFQLPPPEPARYNFPVKRILVTRDQKDHSGRKDFLVCFSLDFCHPYIIARYIKNKLHVIYLTTINSCISAMFSLKVITFPNLLHSEYFHLSVDTFESPFKIRIKCNNLQNSYWDDY